MVYYISVSYCFPFLFTLQTLSGQLEEKENELAAEKKNALKRDKTIQGLSILLKEKERQVTVPFFQIRKEV